MKPISSTEAAKIIGVSRQALSRMIVTGRIKPAMRVGRMAVFTQEQAESLRASWKSLFRKVGRPKGSKDRAPRAKYKAHKRPKRKK